MHRGLGDAFEFPSLRIDIKDDSAGEEKDRLLRQT